MKTVIILLIAIIVINAENYYISFDFYSKNGILTSYNFNCSKSMRISYRFSKLIFVLDTEYDNVKNLCHFQKNQIVDYLLKYKLHLSSYDKKINNSIFFKTKGVFLPKLFDIIIKDKKAYFYVKENN